MEQQYYNGQKKFLIVTDCVIFGFQQDELNVLLVKRDLEPAKGTWSLPTAFVEENESLDNTAKRALAAQTGLEDIYMEQVKCFGDVDRDPYARVLSVVYYALVNVKDYDETLSQRNNAEWMPVNSLPELLFDQKEMIDTAITRMRYRTMAKPIGLKMLPPLFTMTQLRKLVEAINGKPRDKRNFRKVVDEAFYIEKTDLIDKTTSKRGAALYRFNPKLYEQYRKNKL